MPDWPILVSLLAVGLAGGLLGGFLGIGGSVLFIPVLTLLVGADYHTAQAAALVVNICVGASAARGHLKSGLVSGQVLAVLIPCAMGASILGVALSNRFTGAAEVILRRLFAVAMIYVIAVNLYRMVRRHWWQGRMPWTGRKMSRHPVAIGGVGALMGFSSGLLGVGGGSVAVPAQQVLLGMRLKTAVANSSVAIIFSCLLAAIIKHLTLPADVDPVRPWVYVGLLAPTAILGGAVGSTLTHRLSREYVRVVLILFLAWVAYEMLTT